MTRHALVTGGTRGIGRGVAEALLKRGWQVTATGLTEDEAASAGTAEGLTNIALNVTDQAQVTELVSGFGQLDALINCAGMIRRLDEYDLDVFAQVINVNLTGTMRMCMECYPLLKASGGTVVNTASMLSFFGGPPAPAYAASKGGIVQLTKSLAGKWAQDGIRVNAIAPGWIETELTQGMRDDAPRADGILARTPMGRWGKPDEVGDAVAMLLSSDARFITGTILTVDGGYSAI